MAPARKVAGLDELVRAHERVRDGVLDELGRPLLGLGEDMVLAAAGDISDGDDARVKRTDFA
jgi:hypothetical protein